MQTNKVTVYTDYDDNISETCRLYEIYVKNKEAHMETWRTGHTNKMSKKDLKKINI